MGGGRKKVILFFAGTAWLRSCRFLFHQFIQWDKAHKVLGNADVLPPFAAALVGGFDINSLDKFPQSIGCKLVQILVFVYPLDKLLQIFNLSFLYFNILLQGLDFHFKLLLFGFIASAHHGKPFIVLAVVFAVQLFAGTIGGRRNGGLSCAALDLRHMEMI